MTVWLVGAGPGDPDLLTVKAARLLAEADVVVHDALVGDGVLALIPGSAELIDVGKRPGRPTPQEMISTLLVELGRQGKRVVRLKGGDPFVFGRGGEEAQRSPKPACRSRSFPASARRSRHRLRPGSRSPIAASSAAFTVVTGHRREGEHDVDWRSLANVGGTIVVLMGVSQRAQIAAELHRRRPRPDDAGRRHRVGHHRRPGRRSLDPRRVGRPPTSALPRSSSSAPSPAFEFLHDAPTPLGVTVDFAHLS